MKLFNAIQVVMLYGSMPFILVWLTSNPFQYASAAWYVATVMYAGLFAWITYMTFYYFEKDTRKPKCLKCDNDRYMYCSACDKK